MAREKKIHRRTIRSMEDLVSRISSVFLNLRIEDTNDGINEALKLIGTYFRADRAYLFLLSEDKTRLNNTHEWCSAAAEPQIDSLQDIPVSALPWWMEKLSSLSDISVSEVSAMPEEASAERKMLEAQGIRSFLVTPLGYSSRILGFFGLDFLSQSQEIGTGKRNKLRIIAEIFVNALERKRAVFLIQHNEQILREMTENISGAFFLAEPEEKRFIYISPGFSEIWGFSEEEVMKDRSLWHRYIVPEDREEMRAAIRAGENINKEFRIILPGNVRKWLWARTFPIKSVSGYTERIAGFVNDITNRKEVEEKLAAARLREIEVGKAIQNTLLLGKPPENYPDCDIASLTVPSQGIDGDFLDFYTQYEGCFDFVIGDIMGKGSTAALFGAAVKSAFMQALLRLAIADPTPPDPARVLSLVTEQVGKKFIDLSSFLTLIYTRFDLTRSLLLFVDCGHTPIVHYQKRSGTYWFIKGVNSPLGFFECEEYWSHAVPMEEGDLFFFYSDGITEAMNPSGELYGEERLLSCLKENSDINSKGFIEAVRRDVEGFTGNTVFNDDLTCMAFRYLPSAGRGSPKPLRRNITVSSSQEGITRLDDYLKNVLSRIPEGSLTTEECYGIELAVHEAAVNIMEHSYLMKSREIEMEASLHPAWISIALYDTGVPLNLSQAPTPDISQLKERGYGIHIMRKAMESISYANTESGRHCIYLTKFLSG